jgi:glutathione S-transferase
MRVYHSPGSRSTRVLWTLEEAGVSYDVTVLTLDERRGTEHRRLHPLGRVPVIELDDGQLMFESAAICLYLGDLFPESGLVPQMGSAQRPQVLQWVLFAMTEVEPAVGRWSQARREQRDDTEERERFDERASVLSSAIGHGPWLLGDTFTVADIVLRGCSTSSATSSPASIQSSSSTSTASARSLGTRTSAPMRSDARRYDHWQERTRRPTGRATAELTYARGITATGVDEIAAQAGVTKRTLYEHFGSKNTLVAEALRRKAGARYRRSRRTHAVAPRRPASRRSCRSST